MALKFPVFSVFKAQDEVSEKFDKMGKHAKKFGRDSKKSFEKASRGASGLKSVMGGVLAAGAVQKGIGLLTTGLGAVTGEFIQFDGAITNASAKFKGLDLTTAEGQKTLEQLGKTAREVGATTKFSATEAAQGLDFYATAGFTAEQSMAVLAPTAKLATVANLDLARTSDIASDSLGAFGLMTKDATQLQANFTRMNDVMAKTMTSSNVNMEDMFEAIKKGAPTFTATGQSLESFNALMGVMANSGVKGSEAGTQLRNVMLNLAKPTDEAQKALDMIGVTTRDAQGNFRDVIDILGDMEKGFVGYGDAEKAAALKTIFGSRAITGVNLLLQEGSDNLRTFRTDLENAGGSTEKMADIINQSLPNQLASLKSAAIEVGFQLMSAFKGEGMTGIQALTEFIRGIDMTPVIEGIKMVIDVGRDVFEILDKAGFIDLLITTFGALIDIIKLLFKIAVPIFHEIMEALAPVIKLLDFGIGGIGKVAGFLGKFLGGEKQTNAAAAATADYKEISAPQRQAPQNINVAAQSQATLSGNINIGGAPAGTTADFGPGIDYSMQGAPNRQAAGF